MGLGFARGRTPIPLGNPARDTGGPKCWKSQHFGPPYQTRCIARQIWNGVAGPSNPVTPSGVSASSTALPIAGNIAMAPASPQPFTPNGLVVQRVRVETQIESGKIIGARHGVVHERCGNRLAGFRVVDRVLQQRLAGTLGDRAVRLAGGDHRVHQHAVIVHRGQPHQS